MQRPRPFAPAQQVGLAALALLSCAGPLPPAAPTSPPPTAALDPLPTAARGPRLDPAVVDESYAQCPSVTSDATSLRFGGDERALECSRPGACRPHRSLVGASLPELQALAGPPSACRGDTWTFDFGRDCAHERDLLVVVVADRSVVSARHEHAFENEDCEPDAGGL